MTAPAWKSRCPRPGSRSSTCLPRRKTFRMPSPPARWSFRPIRAIRPALPVLVQPWSLSSRLQMTRLLLAWKLRSRSRRPFDGANPSLAIIIRVNPGVRGNFSFLCQPDHVDLRRILQRPEGSAFQCCFQFPYRRVARTANGIERQAGAGLAAVAHHLQPTIAGIEALRDCGRRLRRTTKPIHLCRPQPAFGGIRLAGRFRGTFTCALQADPGAPDTV